MLSCHIIKVSHHVITMSPHRTPQGRAKRIMQSVYLNTRKMDGFAGQPHMPRQSPVLFDAGPEKEWRM